jgi:hypothetical protein
VRSTIRRGSYTKPTTAAPAKRAVKRIAPPLPRSNRGAQLLALPRTGLPILRGRRRPHQLPILGVFENDRRAPLSFGYLGSVQLHPLQLFKSVSAHGPDRYPASLLRVESNENTLAAIPAVLIECR